MKKIFKKITPALVGMVILASPVLSHAEQSSVTHKVVYGDSMWRIAVKYQVGVSEIIGANPQISNPDLIYPGQAITIPKYDAVVAKEKEVIRLVNIERAQYNLKPLANNWELSRVARYKSQDMINNTYFSHTSPVYGTPFTMIKNFGISYGYAGENIAMGQRTPVDVVKGWMNSEGHRKNILSNNYTEIGVGYAVDAKGSPYWTQMFISQ